MPALLAQGWPIGVSVPVFVGGAIVILLIGPRLARVAETLAVRTGLGQAVTGALVLGLSTSLSGSVTSVAAAWRGDAELALSNGLGGIVVQTAFLPIADFFHKRVNLEHAAADAANLLQLGLLLALLGLTLCAFLAPPVSVMGVHPVSLALPVVYLLGLRAAHRSYRRPMWRPAMTPETRTDAPGDGEDDDRRTTGALIGLGLLYGAVIGGCGLALAFTAPAISEATGMTSSAVGAVFTATATSLPELVTCIAATRRGALALAVGDIIGGNAFDTLFAAASDAAFREGSIYHAASDREPFIVGVSIVMSAVLLVGLVVREKRGPARIGAEGVLLLAIYVTGTAVLVAM